MVAGIRMREWVVMWQQCHAFVQGSPFRVAFPDGKPLDKQPALLVNMFSLIQEEWAKELEAQMKR